MKIMKGTRKSAFEIGRKTVVFTILVLWCMVFFQPAILQAKEPESEGTLTFGAENDFAGFELLESSSRLAINDAIAANTIMEPLFRMDADDELIPVLGLSATPSDDGKTWTVPLRQGVRFHDGTPFNADAVVHHWERILNPENKFQGRSGVGPIVSVDKKDEYTVIFNLKHPWLPFKSSIGDSRGLMGLIPSSKAVETGIQQRSPVGTGPFKFESWKTGDSLTVVKNPDYWQKDKPFLERITFSSLPDSQTRFASLKSGRMDIIWMDQGNIIEKAKNDPDLRVYAGDDNGAEIFVLNTGKPPFDNVDVRRAFAHAHNQDLQVKMAYKNSIPVVHHPFGNQCQCSEDGYRAHDQDQARKLLAQYGQKLEVEILHTNSKRGRDIGEITQRLLKDVGVSATPVGLDFGPIIQKVLGGDYQMSTWRISSRSDQGPALFWMLHSESLANYSRYKNPELDKLLVAQRMETDPAKRETILCEVARVINDEAPILYRGGMRSHVIASNKVEGISALNNGILRLEEARISR